jgi:predicted MPP superfamily phosphohydrolase
VSHVSVRRLRVRIVASALAGACLLDGFVVEPRWVEVTHPSLPAPVRAPVHVLHISDLHGDAPGAVEQRVLDVLAAEAPDLVVLTGDSTDRGSLAGELPFLSRLRAPLGVFAVRGNWEHWRPVPDEASTYAAAGIVLLSDEARKVRDDLWMVGFEDAASGEPDVARALRGVPSGVAILGLTHSPALFERVAGRVSILLAGHTHGGQVRVPLLPPLWLPPGSGSYAEGLYASEGSSLYVSRGLGTSVLPVRFACRPELPVVTLVPTPR